MTDLLKLELNLRLNKNNNKIDNNNLKLLGETFKKIIKLTLINLEMEYKINL